MPPFRQIGSKRPRFGNWRWIQSAQGNLRWQWNGTNCMGVKVYQFDICEAIGEQNDCPGVTTLKAGDHDLGTVACNSSCHKKPETKYPSNAPYL
jgi:hypothetical protein